MKNENFGGEQRKSALKLFELKISGIYLLIRNYLTMLGIFIYYVCSMIGCYKS